ncbi:MAG: hypothetical protein K2N46_08405, partial [Lachnospiraceae bacterium]|nr:hypothetical protein [Lachnospiraceae bacterium]
IYDNIMKKGEDNVKNQKDERERPVSKAGLSPVLIHVIISISKNRNSDRERGGNYENITEACHDRDDG